MKARLAMGAGLLLAGVLGAASAGAQDPLPPASPADTTLGRYLGAMSDSTDRYFGITAAPVDTAGLDTARALSAAKHGLSVGFRPTFGFNRVTGNTWGGGLELGDVAGGRDGGGLGRLKGALAYAAGIDTWLGQVEYVSRRRVAGLPFALRVAGGRRIAAMNRDENEPVLNTLRALLNGHDFTHYLRGDGFEASLVLERAAWRVGTGYSGWLESPLPVTTTWSLAGDGPRVPGNLPAVPGRARELQFEAGLHLARVPLHAEARGARSSAAIGSDFDYERWRAAVGLDFSLGRVASLLPQFAYGRLTGQALPQDAFYLGSRSTLRGQPRDAIGGTRLAVAKLGLLGAQDLLAMLHLPHAAAFPLQGELFAASAAVWGREPFSGEVRPGGDWPERRAWLSEAGASLLYGSVLFDHHSYLRLSYAHPLGPGGDAGHWTFSYSRALDLLSPWASGE